jgi:hypothetical protein
MIFLAVATSSMSANKPLLEHDVPTGVIRGEKACIEVMAVTGGHVVHDMRVFYRELGDENYKQIPMKQEGYIYTTDINTSDITSGRIEYFIAYEGNLGITGTMPELNPQLNPYVMRIAPAKTVKQATDFELVILSPQPEDILVEDEVLIAVSVMGGESEIDFTLSRLYIDEVDVTTAADFSDGIITYVPSMIRLGRHIIKLDLYDNSGELLMTREWGFRVIKTVSAVPGLRMSGSLVLDNRYQNVSDEKDNFFRGGGHVSLSYGSFDLYSRVLFSSEEEATRQPVNRYSSELRYNITDRSNIYINGGDVIPFYNPLVFQDKRVRGLQTGLALGFFTFDYIYGQTYRGVEGSLETDEIGDTTQVNGTYSEKIMAIRPGFRFGERVHWRLNLVNAKQDEHSIAYGGNVRESLILGTDLNMNFDRRRILFEASFQASVKNSDAAGPEVEYDDLVEVDSSLADNAQAERIFNTLKKVGFLSITGGLNPYPSLAMQYDLQLRYFNNNLRLTYLNIASEFESPGNPYLLKDIAGFYLTDHIRLFKNQVYMNLFFKSYKNNLVDTENRTNNTEFGATVSYFPFRNLPSLTFGYAKHDRDNAVTQQDTAASSYLYIEDNHTQRLTLASSYDLKLGKVRNTFSVNYSKYLRDDAAFEENTSDFHALIVSLRTRFPFPLTARISYSQSQTTYGDTLQTTLDVGRYNFRLDYRLENLFTRDALRPFVNVSLQNIESDYTESESTTTNRTNISAGIAYQTSRYGVFTLRFDKISYSLLGEDVDDQIINARYEVNF